jgi:hypothetical protein
MQSNCVEKVTRLDMIIEARISFTTQEADMPTIVQHTPSTRVGLKRKKEVSLSTCDAKVRYFLTAPGGLSGKEYVRKA